MSSTSQSVSRPAGAEQPEVLTWRSWPLVDQPRLTWLILVLLVCFGGSVWYLGSSAILALAAVVGLSVTLWSFLLPVHYEIAPIGIRRRVLNRTRLVPWYAIRAYQLRDSGIVLYQHSKADSLELLQSLFVPFPPEGDELLVTVRLYASHAIQLPR